MNTTTMISLGHISAFITLAVTAIGSAFGTGIAVTAAVGAWKKCYLQNKPAPFQLVIFSGSPISQVIYGMIVMFIINGKVATSYAHWVAFLAIGILSGLGLGIVSWLQGIVAAAACDAFGESTKGFVNYLMSIGIIETVSIFVMAFAIVILASF